MRVVWRTVRYRDSEQGIETAERKKLSSAASRSRSRWILNILITVLFLLVAYFSYAFFTNNFYNPAEEKGKAFSPTGKPIQLDVLNGCGVSGVASKFTTYLRRHGFDVVEMRNYRSFDIQETLVIDRVGNLAKAHRVAQALGIKQENVIQEINPDYFVDVSVVIGKDYPKLRLSQ